MLRKPFRGAIVDLDKKLRTLVDVALNLEGRSGAFTVDTPLLGAVPELDSMGVVAVITALEEGLGIAIDDDEIDGAVFHTWGSLLSFVRGKLA